jgi:hypothetical protein
VRTSLGLATVLSAGCALAPGGPEPGPTPVSVRSHNRSAVDVYLLCGDRNARWLGEVSGKAAGALEIPARQAYCPLGLNFFLLVRTSGRGYWVGPFSSGNGGRVELVIEKYAGLSSARLLRDGS